jgi:hypothetical protein
MRRREFIAGLGSAGVPLEARAQLGDHARRIGMLLPYDQNDPVAKTRVSAFMQALAELGWTDGHNVRMDLGWAGGDINRIRALAHELVALQTGHCRGRRDPDDRCPPAGNNDDPNRHDERGRSRRQRLRCGA